MNITEALIKELPTMCGQQIYFHDRENNHYLSGIYTVASMDLQDPTTEHVLLFRDKQQAWVKPEDMQPDHHLKSIENIERVVLDKADGTFEFRSIDVAAVMLKIAAAKVNRKQNAVVVTGKAMELLSQFRSNSHITNEGCTLMTYDYWRKNYASEEEL